jgi:L-threonylcarbamoyladenylate synthase
MKSRVLNAGQSQAIQEAVTAIRAGKLVAFPTDTVYGLGADAFFGPAIARLYLAKGRSPAKGIPVLLSSVDKLSLVAKEVPQIALELITIHWPGPLTLIVPKKENLPDIISAGDTIAVRVPNNDIALRFIARAGGALAVSSANLSGKAAPKTAGEALHSLGDSVDIVLDGGPVEYGQASTILDCTAFPPKIIRKGPISAAELGLGSPGLRID